MSYVFNDSFYAMGTRCHVVLPGIDHDRGDQITRVLKQEINRVETALSRFISYSDIAIINQKASQEPVPVSEETFRILQTCIDYHGRTEGAFDITLRKLLDYWKTKDADDRATSDLYQILDHTGTRQIELNEENLTVFLKNDRVELDLGGFGKGYALSKVEEFLDDFSVQHAFISFGESSVITRGAHPAGDHWKIGVNHHLNPGQSIHTFHVTEGSVSTSGNFYLDNHGKLKNHRHVINPFNGYPVRDLVSVSVQARSSVVAEILSTAYLVLSDDLMDVVRHDVPDCEIVKITYRGTEPEVRIVHKQQDASV
jgi:thiamine biosynthesis lipoprotein